MVKSDIQNFLDDNTKQHYTIKNIKVEYSPDLFHQATGYSIDLSDDRKIKLEPFYVTFNEYKKQWSTYRGSSFDDIKQYQLHTSRYDDGMDKYTGNYDHQLIGDVVSKFYDWYIDQTNKGKQSAYYPSFAKSVNGMTTLTFSQYVDNLRKYSFSDSLINQEINSYQDCLNHLSNVQYSHFVEWTDLDQFEESNCDFNNTYRWTGGQEPVFAIKIDSIISNKNGGYEVTIYQYSSLSEFNKETTNNSVKINLVSYEFRKWLINSINTK